MIFRGRWSLTLHWRSIFNLEVFEFNWKVNERRGIGRREDHLGPRTICFSSFYSSVWIRSHSRVDTNHVLRFTIACTYFVTAAHHPTHCQGMLGLNDATSTVESFPVFSFPQAFSTPGLLSRRIGQTDLPLSSSSPHLIFFSIDLFTENIFNDRQTFQATTV